MFKSDAREVLRDVAKSIQRTQLTPEEHIITQAMVLFFPGKLADKPPQQNYST